MRNKIKLKKAMRKIYDDNYKSNTIQTFLMVRSVLNMRSIILIYSFYKNIANKAILLMNIPHLCAISFSLVFFFSSFVPFNLFKFMEW